jgi:hypothetical protein
MNDDRRVLETRACRHPHERGVIDVSTNRHQQLAAELAAAHDRVRKAITDLTEEDASATGPDGWSIKDHLTHLTLWHEMRFFEISRVGRGGQFTVPLSSEEQVTPMNETIAAYRRGLSLQQVVADLEFAWSMVEQAVSACPEDRLAHGFGGEIGPVGTAHDISHAQMIKALRDRPA